MVFDRKRDRLIVVEGAGQTDRIQVSALDPTLEERTILDRLTVPGVGRLNVAIAPDGGAIWLHRNRSTRVTRLGGAQSELRGAREPNGLVISEDGRLLFEDGRRLQAYVDSDGDPRADRGRRGPRPAAHPASAGDIRELRQLRSGHHERARLLPPPSRTAPLTDLHPEKSSPEVAKESARSRLYL